MTPTLSGRIQTRLLLLALIGAPWTAVITPALPRPGWVPLSMLYDIMFRGLLIVAVVGVAWELIYHAVQQLRWDKDWPSLLQLLVMVNEAVVVWLILHAFHTIPGTVGFSAPLLAAYSIYFASTWTLVWLVMHGPMRVLALRWRFEGARVLPHRVRVPDRPAGAEGPRKLHSPREPEPGQTERGQTSSDVLVKGISCPRGHFNHPASAFCVRCGHSLRHERTAPVTGSRPSLGDLVLDNGTSVSLDGNYVVGAKPKRDSSVLSGRAQPLTLRASAGSIAAVHLEIQLHDWQIMLLDRGSPGGTRIAAPPGVAWTRLPPRQATPVLPGTTVGVGDRTFVIESPWPLALNSQAAEPSAVARSRRPQPPSSSGRHRASGTTRAGQAPQSRV